LSHYEYKFGCLVENGDFEMPELIMILSEMEKNEVVFKTAGGRQPLKIRNVDLINQNFCFERSTGKISLPLSIENFEALYRDISENKLDLDYKQIDKILPTFGNYSAGFIEYINRGNIKGI
jgi:hypothetical protein